MTTLGTGDVFSIAAIIISIIVIIINLKR